MSFFNYSEFYAEVAANPHYQVFIELGVYRGDSLEFLYHQLEKRGTPYFLIGIDLWEQVQERTDYDRVIEPAIRQTVEERFSCLNAVHLIQEESAEAAIRFKDRTVDFVFIDANHSVDHVTRDIQAWLPKIAPGGTISGHDFGEPCGVQEAVVNIFGAGNFKVQGTVWSKVIA